MKRVSPLLFVLLFAFGCTTSRHLSNGDAMMMQQNYERAAREYSSALQNSPNNTKAFTGLQNASDQYIKTQTDKFDKLYSSREYVKAEGTMANILKFADTYSKHGIKTDVPQREISKQQDITNATAEFYYRHGVRELSNGNFNTAISHFSKTEQSVPNYKNVKALRQQAENAARMQNAEMHYQKGLENYKTGNFRRAYTDFGNALSQVREYRNAAELRQTALDKGKVRVAFLPFINNSRFHGLERSLESNVVNDVMKANNPFIDVVDRQNIDRVLSEINFSYSSSVNPATVNRAGEMLGASFFITGQISNVVARNPEIRTRTMNAFEFEFGYVNDAPRISSKPARYTIHDESLSVTHRIEYQIISVETGRVIKSNMISEDAGDQITYARYQGNVRYLISYDPQLLLGEFDLAKGFTAFTQSALNKIDYRLFNARSTIKTPDELNDEILIKVAKKIASEVIREFN